MTRNKVIYFIKRGTIKFSGFIVIMNNDEHNTKI